MVKTTTSYVECPKCKKPILKASLQYEYRCTKYGHSVSGKPAAAAPTQKGAGPTSKSPAAAPARRPHYIYEDNVTITHSKKTWMLWMFFLGLGLGMMLAATIITAV